MSRRTPLSPAGLPSAPRLLSQHSLPRGYAGRHRRPGPDPLAVASRRLAAATLSAGLVVAVVPAATMAVAQPKTGVTASAATERPVLKYGSRGADVLWVQKHLGVRPTSGWYGPITRAAVKRYQRAHGIKTTGMVGPLTWASLLAGRPSRSSARTPTGTAALNWRALAHCESSGNPRAVNPAGYYGLYQFDLRTWRGVGGSGHPHHASVVEQTKRAQRLYDDRGASPWPHCGRLLHT